MSGYDERTADLARRLTDVVDDLEERHISALGASHYVTGPSGLPRLTIADTVQLVLLWTSQDDGRTDD